MEISIILPAYNEQDNIGYIYNKILEKLNEYSLEVIFVDDGSEDKTFDFIRNISDKNQNVKGIRFSRNFGHQAALMAGLEAATGDMIVSMDSDGQHPPEVIIDMINKCKEGYDVVNTERLATEDAGFFKNTSSVLFYKFLNRLSEVPIPSGSSDFRLMTRPFVDAFLRLDETDRFNRGLIRWLGFRQTTVQFIAPKRVYGTSKYTLKKMIKFGIDGITSFSAKPLRVSFGAGVIAIFLGFIYGIYSVFTFITGKAIPGWPSIIITILFIGGFQLLMLGIIGEYIARIFNETKRRPHFIISEKCG